MCATFWCGVIFIMSSIILLVTSRHKGRYSHHIYYQHSLSAMSLVYFVYWKLLENCNSLISNIKCDNI